jgi:hypothetical protein
MNYIADHFRTVYALTAVIAFAGGPSVVMLAMVMRDRRKD